MSSAVSFRVLQLNDRISPLGEIPVCVIPAPSGQMHFLLLKLFETKGPLAREPRLWKQSHPCLCAWGLSKRCLCPDVAGAAVLMLGVTSVP